MRGQNHSITGIFFTMATSSAKMFSTNMSNVQCKDTGMAMTLIILILGLWLDTVLFFKIGFFLLLINMIYPKSYYPLAIIWYGLSNVLGSIMSKVLLSVVFFVIVFPIGTLRRILGKDSLKLKHFKKGTESVMKVREHEFTAGDMESPF